ncbi:hypothetical protein [Desertivirga arenae]|uniref:hypothetical protein n=1 Tax=Desertivirga arenae TaxID=2810309 RepID=UPI001A95B62E|nr:hypothetical protein [Pedobacter sp. SYSU D00823]
MVRINGNFDRKDFAKAQNFKIKLTTAHLRMNATIFLTFGIILIGLTWNDSSDYLSYWFPFIYGLYCLIQLIQIKFEAARMISKYSDRFEKMGLKWEYMFNEQGLSYQDDEKSFFYKWEVLKGFSLVKGYLIFHVLDKRSCDILIDRACFSDEAFGILDDYLGKSNQVLL